MEAVAMDKLVEKGDLSPQAALAFAEALDITIKAANLATVPLLDARFAQQDAKMEARFAQQDVRFAQLAARFAQQDAKMEARFGSIEKLIESTKVWATLLYAGLAAVVFGALSVDHRWLVNREDQLVAQIQARSDARSAEEEVHTDRLFAEDDARTDRLIAEDRAHTDRLVAEQQANAKQAEARMDAKLDQLRALLINSSLKPGSTTRISPRP
jgi:hypothetical protein